MGELIALLSAAFYGLAGVTIFKARTDRQGDGGVFLSILITALFTGLLWVCMGAPDAVGLSTRHWRDALVLFAIAGLFATVLGRVSMYRSTELIGSVGSSMLRRLIPLFAIPCSVLLIGEWPTGSDLIGGAIILTGVLAYTARSGQLGSGIGVLFGIGSALSYAVSYALRKAGLVILPDPVLGTFVGAMTGVAFYLGWCVTSRAPKKKFRYLIADRGRWFLLTALSLSFGQTLQLFALQASSVAVVSFVGALDVLFTTVFASLIFGYRLFHNARFLVAIILVILGTGYLAFAA